MFIKYCIKGLGFDVHIIDCRHVQTKKELCLSEFLRSLPIKRSKCQRNKNEDECVILYSEYLLHQSCKQKEVKLDTVCQQVPFFLSRVLNTT